MLNLLIQNINNASFYLAGGLTCVFALLVVVSRNAFHSAVFLALTLLSISGIYFLLDAQFLAVTQIIIYVGAVMILFTFVIMLTSRISDKAIRQVNQQVILSLGAALSFLGILFILIFKSQWLIPVEPAFPLPLKELGRSLLSKYLLPFEFISLVLLAVMIGAIVIAKANKKE